MAYDKCNLWQRYYGKCNYGKSIMANETEPIWMVGSFNSDILKKKVPNNKIFNIWTNDRKRKLLYIISES